MPSKAKEKESPEAAGPELEAEAIVIDDPETQSADLGGEKTVVYKDTNGDWDYAHLNADGEPWIHSPDHEKWSKDECIAQAGLAFPAWPVEVVKDNPWNVEDADAD